MLTADWFQALFGFEETSPEAVHAMLTHHSGTLSSKANGQSFHCGTLEIPTLQQLRARALPLLRLASPAPSTFTERVGNVQVLHTLPEYAGALVQAASQFNLLEMVNPDITPERGISGYFYDHTQGPACALACAAGTVYRNYFVPLPGQIGQSSTQQIDCLDEMARAFNNAELQLWSMQNGYALATAQGLQHIGGVLQNATPAQLHHLKGRLKIGLQWDTAVTLPGVAHRLSQAYCSALPVAYSPVDAALWAPFARLILSATYEATLLAALLNRQRTGSHTVLLTLVGGGAFGNKASWLVEEVSGALRPFARAGLQVQFVSYGQPSTVVAAILERLVG